MPVCEEWVSEEVSDEESDEELHVYEFKTTETRAKYLCRDLYVLVEASARHPLRVRGSDASVRQAKKIQTDMQNMQIAAQLVELSGGDTAEQQRNAAPGAVHAPPACAGQKRSHHFDGTGNSAAKEQLHSPALRKAPGVGQYKRGAQPACKRCDGCVTKKGGCLRRKEDEAATGGDPGNKCRKKVRAADASTSNTPGNAPAQLEQYKRGGSSKKGKSKRGKGPCLRLSSRKGKAKGKSSKGKAEMQGGSSKKTLQQEAATTLGNTKEDRLERAEKRQKTAEKRQRDVLMRTSLWQKARDEKAERENDLRLLFPPSNVPLGPWSWKQHYDEKPTKYNSWPPQQ